MYAKPVVRLSAPSQAESANTLRERSRPRSALYFRAPPGAPNFLHPTSNIQHPTLSNLLCRAGQWVRLRYSVCFTFFRLVVKKSGCSATHFS